MKFVALVSGGKDSIYSILECRRHGHELIGCVHLGAAINSDEESYMYQSAASEALTTLVEECLGVPLIHYQRVGKSIDTSLVYQEALDGDEVEDLYQALSMAKTRFPEVQAVSSGAILSTYQRVRIEHVCSRLQLASLSYLWRAAPQHDLLDRMIRDGITAVLVRAACPPGLVPQKHLNKTLQELQPHFLRLNQRYQFHVCGEGGEYESLVLDCPLYKKRLVLDEVEVVELEDDEGVGVLKILKCHAEDKPTIQSQNSQETTSIEERALQRFSSAKSSASGLLSRQSPRPLVGPPSTPRHLPRIKHTGGGLWHVSEIMVPIAPKMIGNETEAELAVQEARTVFEILLTLLQRNGCTAQDVIFVHLYLSEISHFASINAFYSQFFGTLLPPSRSCVAVGPSALPGGRRVHLDCMVQCGSGDYLRGRQDSPSLYALTALDDKTSNLRQVLHVQSISHWAPVCVGPYSQVNTLRNGLHFMAGQIGLIPSTMTLHAEWKDQLYQCWMNVASILDALNGGSMEQLLSGVVYVADKVYFQNVAASENDDVPTIRDVEMICLTQLRNNGGIVAGKVDSPTASTEDDDSEGVHVVNGSSCPLLIVSIPEMPVGSQVEVEVIAATRQAAGCLSIMDTDVSRDFDNQMQGSRSTWESWDTGHDFPKTTTEGVEKSCPDINVQVALRSLGVGCAGIAMVTAGCWMSDVQAGAAFGLDTEQLLVDMLGAFEKSLTTSDGEISSGLRLSDVLHVRLFYVPSKVQQESGEKVIEDDGLLLRSAFQAALASCFASSHDKRRNGLSIPASSIIPAQAIHLLRQKEDVKISTSTTSQSIFMALQILAIDPLRMESELWIHHGR